MALARVIAALAGSALLGAAINRFEPWFEANQRPRIAGGSPELDRGCDENPNEQPAGQRLAHNAYAITRRLIAYFAIGMALAATVSTLLPADAIRHALGGTHGIWVYLLAAVAGAPLYVCQGEEVPLTYALVASGVAAGPALTFLLGAVGMCLPTVAISRGVLAPRVTYLYIAFWIAFVIVAGATFQALVH
jgi:uncharacterized membrane protein YraQ (UPF0718 family)